MDKIYVVFVLSSLCGCSGFTLKDTESLKKYDDVSDPSTTPSGPPAFWFDQKLDHFNVADNRMWKQKYYVNEQFYKPGGPAFLYIGDEAPLEANEILKGAWLEYAQVYHAICFAVEHRYYGDSRPTPDLSTPNLKYLTVENELEDLAEFVRDISIARNITNARWITFGGSYAGMLSAYMRYKFPHLITGAVAHSAPLGLEPFIPKFAYGIGESLRTVPGCFNAVEAAFAEVRSKMQSDAGAAELAKLFYFCPFDRANPGDVGNVYISLLLNVLFTVQVSDVHFLDDPKQYLSIKSLCQVMMDKSIGTPLDRMANYAHPYFGTNTTDPIPTPLPCSNQTFASYSYYTTNLDYDKNLNTFTCRQWNYQECTQLGGFVTTNITGSPFGDILNEQYFSRKCQVYFGPDFNSSRFRLGNSELHMNYGGLSMRETNVVYTQGQYDPYRQYGFNHSPNSGAHVIVMQGVGHGADMYASTALDKPSVTQARRRIQRYIGQWITRSPGTIFG